MHVLHGLANIQLLDTAVPFIANPPEVNFILEYDPSVCPYTPAEDWSTISIK